LVQFSFTQEEKKKRNSSVKQSPISNPVIQGKAVFYEPNLDSILIGRFLYILKTRSLFLEVLMYDGIRQLLEADAAKGDKTMLGLCSTFVSDTRSLISMLNMFSVPF